MTPPAKRILALDLALETGWAHSCGESGIWHLGIGDSEHAGNRLVRLEGRIMAMHLEWGIDQVAFEVAAYGSHHANTRQFHDQVMGVVLLSAAKICAPWVGYSPTEIKKFWTGHGQADKAAMIRACQTFLGRTVTNDNEADALAILELAKHQATSKLAAAIEKKTKRPRPAKQMKLGYQP